LPLNGYRIGDQLHIIFIGLILHNKNFKIDVSTWLTFRT